MQQIRLSFLYAFLFLIAACKDDKKKNVIHEGIAFQVDSLPGNCPYITKDTKGNPVISWARKINDSVSVLCYALSVDEGKSFQKPMTVPFSNLQPHSENLPKIVFKPSGEIIALWGRANPNPKNKYSGLVFYSQSFDEGSTWTPPKPLVADTASYDQRYYDVALLPGGEAAIIWLDNRKATEKKGSGLYYAVTDGRKGFQHERMIGDGCCECCRTDLFIDSNAGIHVLYRGIIKDSIRDMLHCVSVDGGQAFSSPRIINNDNWVINGCPHTGPAMAENNQGLHFAWFTGAGNKGCFYTRSPDNGNSFTGYDKISAMGSHPQVLTLADGRLIIGWDESVKVNKEYYKRIALQIRSASGASEEQGFITPDTLMATYPVIGNLRNQDVLIAYTQLDRGQEKVVYQCWHR
jgi:hypothetical protein